MTARRAARRAGPGVWLAVGLLAFVGAAVIVVWRRARGDVEERTIVRLEAERRDLDAQRVALERDLQAAMSAGRIAPLARRRLGLRLPSDSQLITLVRGRVVDAPRDSVSSDQP